MVYQRICLRCMKEKENSSDICPYCGRNPADYQVRSYVLQPFTVLHGKYLIGEVLGAGGFGITYVALDMALERRVAVKEFYLQGSMYRQSTSSSVVTALNSDQYHEKMLEINRVKFEEEAKTLAQLEHLPGIVGVFEYFKENNTSYIVLEYLDGVTLKEQVRRQGGRIPFPRVMERLQPVMNSLAVLHDRKLLHRDISPDNIMVMKDGGMTLFDFGGAKQLRENEEQHSIMVMKKAGYTPIEQYSNREQGPWTDEYALAATMYYCITGIVPVESIERNFEKDMLKRPSELGVDIPPGQEAVLMKAMSIRPEDRFPDVREFQRALLTGVLQEPPKKHVSETRRPIEPPPAEEEEGGLSAKTSILLIILGLAAGVLIAAMITLFLSGGTGAIGKKKDSAPEKPAVSSVPAAEPEKPAVSLSPEPESERPAVSSVPAAESEKPAVSSAPAAESEKPAASSAPAAESEKPAASSAPAAESEKPAAASSTAQPVTSTPKPEKEKIIPDFLPWSDSGQTDRAIIWHDEVLEQRIREKFEITGRDVMLSDLWEEERIWVNGKDANTEPKITDISDLAVLQNLKELNLNYNSIGDLTPLANLKNLEWLTVNTNQVSDISPLAGLDKIETIDLSNNTVSDFSALGEMEALARVTVYNTGITDADFGSFLDLLKKEQVTKLDLGGNQITEFGRLAEFPKLEKAALWDSHIDDAKLRQLVDVVKGLPAFDQFALKGNQITDVTPLAELPNLRVINLNNNQIRDISPLGSLQHLEELRIANNQITDFSPVENKGIKTLQLN